MILYAEKEEVHEDDCPCVDCAVEARVEADPTAGLRDDGDEWCLVGVEDALAAIIRGDPDDPEFARVVLAAARAIRDAARLTIRAREEWDRAGGGT